MIGFFHFSFAHRIGRRKKNVFRFSILGMGIDALFLIFIFCFILKNDCSKDTRIPVLLRGLLYFSTLSAQYQFDQQEAVKAQVAPPPAGGHSDGQTHWSVDTTVVCEVHFCI